MADKKLNNLYPALTGGTFFTLILEARKARSGKKTQLYGNRDGLSETDLLTGLVRIMYPEFKEPNDNKTYSASVSAYKTCVNDGVNLPFLHSKERHAFDRRIKDDYAGALAFMCNFINRFLEVGASTKKEDWLVKALLELIDKDSSIEDSEEFFACENGQKITKAVLCNTTDFYLQSFLLGIWHFIIVNRQDNTSGSTTFNSWCPPKNRRTRVYEGHMGENDKRKLNISLPVKPVQMPSKNIENSEIANNDVVAYIDSYLGNISAFYEKLRPMLSDTSKQFYSFYVCNDLEYGRENLVNITAKKLCEHSRFTIISGSGGFGKSMLMRHLLLSCVGEFAESKLLPILVRLGDYAYSNNSELLDFVLAQMNNCAAQIKKEELMTLLEKGECLLLFDGLDEISPNTVGLFDYKLRAFIAAYAKNAFVISTRPINTHKLQSLERFDTMKLQPLNYKQALELLSKLEAPEPLASKKFSEYLTPTLFEKHKSFMQNPLLLTVMFMTFKRIKHIPKQLHLFYREAVQTLTEMYDAHNPNEKRMLKTKLSVPTLLSQFSAFCYKAFEDEKTGFTDATFDRNMRQLNINVNQTDFIFDVCDNLCLLEDMGGNYRFYHRSMRDYFCAEYLSKLPPEQLGGFITMLQKQRQEWGSSVLRMLFEISPDTVERFIFLPFLTQLFGKSKKHIGYYNYLFTQYPVIYYDHEDNGDEANNEPQAPLLSFLFDMLDVRYEYSPSNFGFHEELADTVYLMPIMSFGDDVEFELVDKADEIFPPDFTRMSVRDFDRYDGDTIYEEMGWGLEFNPQEIFLYYENEGKYADIYCR